MSVPVQSSSPLALTPSEVGVDLLTSIYGPSSSGTSLYRSSPASSQGPPSLATLVGGGDDDLALTLTLPPSLTLRASPKEVPPPSIQRCSLVGVVTFLVALALALGLGLGLGLRPSLSGVNGPSSSSTPSPAPSASSKMANVSSFINVVSFFF
jgi:hypothetical protein